MKCPNCGEQLPEGARFCGACGNMLAEPVNMDVAEATSAEEVTASGYEEGLNAAERTAAPEPAEEPSQANVTAAPEYAGESVPTEGAKAPEVEEMPAEFAEEVRNPDASESQAEQSAVQKPRKNNVLPILLIAGIVIIIIAVNVIIAMMPTEEERWQEQYDLGQQYLLELDYEQAIVAFTAAIEIDGNNAQAYVARAEVYLAADVAGAEDSSETEAAEDVILSDYQAAALEDYLTAIGLDDTLEDAYIGAAGLYVAAGEDDFAMELLSSYPAGDDDLPEQIAAMLEELSNQTGKKSLCIKYSGEGYYCLYEYDVYGNCLLENYYVDDTLNSYYAYFYDESGNQVLRIC